MSYEHSSVNWNCDQITTMIKTGKISFDNVVQRSFVWEKTRKSLLIHSLVIGFPIPAVFAKKSVVQKEKGKNFNFYDVLDGKQRLLTISEFFNDGFKLTRLPKARYFDIEKNEMVAMNLSGLKFSELPEAVQKIIVSSRINVVSFDNLEKEEESELFRRINNGKPLSSKSKLLASTKDLDKFISIGQHQLFEEMLSKRARENKNQVTIIIKIWCMLNMNVEEISFQSSYLTPLVEVTELSEDEEKEILELLDFTVGIHKNLIDRGEKDVAKKLYTETHFISLVPFLDMLKEKEVTVERAADWLIHFYTTGDNRASISDKYNVALNGSAKSSNIEARDDVLWDDISAFFKEINFEPPEDNTSEEDNTPQEEASGETEETMQENNDAVQQS